MPIRWRRGRFGVKLAGRARGGGAVPGGAKGEVGMMLTCQAIFGVQRGDELRALVEEATGDLCPCRRGQPCPLMPRGLADDVDVPTPRRLRGELGTARVVVAAALAGYGLAAMKVGSAVL